METKARLTDISQSLIDKKTRFTFETSSEIAAEELERLKDSDLRVSVKKYRKKRSLSANNLFWHMVGQISKATGGDKWDIYLSLLRRYGRFTYLCVSPSAVKAVREQWRECEEWNSLTINGKPAVQLLCYFGSSSYNTAEMARLIDGTMSEMRELGLDLPMTQDIKTALEQWEVQNGQHNSER